jgi:hypothetical protein
MKDIEQLVGQQEGLGLLWTGLSYQEQQSTNQAIWLYLISIAFIFLCLAALYESLRIPMAVMTAIPLGIGGSIIFAHIFALPNDVYFQIALLTTIGLSCKNAILIVEFAAMAQAQGKSAIQAALQGAGLRLRPILMTSFAFGAGVIPLVFAFGAGAVSRQEIGISVLGGVIFGTILVLIFIPFMFVLVASITKDNLIIEYVDKPHEREYSLDIAEILSQFGIKEYELDLPKFNELPVGKLSPIPEATRRDFIYKLTNEHDIYSFGRNGIWKSIRLDELFEDILKIDKMIENGLYYRNKSLASEL